MTKNRIIGAIAALALLAVPAVAAAHGSGDDHGRRGDDHGRHHHHKHHGKKAKTRDVTRSATGTVTSFTNGELTITLTNGKVFTADVKRRTVIRCKTAPVVPATTARHGDDDGNNGSGRGGRDDGPNHDAGDDHGDHPATTTAPASTTAPSTTVPPTTDDHGNDDHNNGHGARCGTAALVAGTKVLKAKLTLKDGTATWKKVTLLK
jgi:hypothetical protein